MHVTFGNGLLLHLVRVLPLGNHRLNKVNSAVILFPNQPNSCFTLCNSTSADRVVSGPSHVGYNFSLAFLL